MKLSAKLLPLLLSLFPACGAKLSFKSGKASVASTSGSVSSTLSLEPGEGFQLVKVLSDESLKLAFTVFDDAENVDVQPHQTFLRFWDPETDEEGTIPVKVSKDGKARFSLNMRRPPPGLPPSGANPLKVSLILGSFTHESATYDLFDLSIPPSAPVAPHPEEYKFHHQPEIFHTFRPEQKVPNKVISIMFMGATLSPWLVLAVFLPQIGVSVIPNARTIPFLLLLAAFEGLLFTYWVKLRLGDVLLYGSVLAIATAIAGKNALSAPK